MYVTWILEIQKSDANLILRYYWYKKIQTKLFIILMNLSIILNLMRQISDVKPIKDTIAND